MSESLKEKPMKPIYVFILMIGLSACASGPSETEQVEPKTLMGYTVDQAKIEMALTPDPNDISISACHLENGQLVHELNQLRMRLQNDHTQRKGKQFIEQYNHRVLYPINQ